MPFLAISQVSSISFEELEEKRKTSDKHCVVFLYTDWCKFCKLMENTTFKNRELASLLNNEYYFIRLDGEEKSDIIYRERTFSFIPSGKNSGIHELAEMLGTEKGRLVFPTICILNKKDEVIFRFSGKLNARELKTILNRLSDQSVD